jgi:hypothetical protein
LFEVAHKVPVPVLEVSLEPPGSFFDLGTPKIHVPGSDLIFIDLGPGILTSNTQDQGKQKHDLYKDFSH